MFLVLAFTSSFHSQNNSEIDSLQRLLKSNQLKDTTRINIYNELCWPIYASLNADSSIFYGKKAIDLCIKTNDTARLIVAYRRIGISHINSGNHSNAEFYEQKSYNLAKLRNDKKAMSSALNNLSVIHLNISDFKKAIDYSLQSQKIQEELKDSGNLFQLYYNLGLLFKNIDDLKKSKSYYLKAYAIAKKEQNLDQIGFTKESIGLLFKKEGKYDSSLIYLKEAEKIFETVKDKRGTIEILSSLGSLYSAWQPKSEKNYRLALYYFFESLEKNKDFNNSLTMANDYGNIAMVYHQLHKPDSVIYFGKKALEYASKANDLGEVVFTSKLLSDAYLNKNDYKKSLEYLSIHMQTKDSVFNIEKQKEITQNQIEYEFEKKAIADSLKIAEERKLTHEKSKQESIIRYGLISFAIALAIFSYIMFNRFKITNEQKKIIETQKHIVDEKQKEIVDSINYAKKIQYTLLANNNTLIENIKNHFVLFAPKDIVSGDFYWAAKNENGFYLAVCDSTGHGVPGAFMSLLNTNFLNEAINEKKIKEPNLIFNYVRNKLINSVGKEGQKDGFDGILLRIENNTNEITYSAANNAPIIIANSQITELEYDRMPVGEGVRTEEFRLYNIQPYKNTENALYLYTDGFADQFGGPKGKKFKYRQLNELLMTLEEIPINQQAEILSETFNKWKGNLEQVDDVCIIGIKI